MLKNNEADEADLSDKASDLYWGSFSSNISREANYLTLTSSFTCTGKCALRVFERRVVWILLEGRDMSSRLKNVARRGNSLSVRFNKYSESRSASKFTVSVLSTLTREIKIS